jgi:hypothetical protein
MAKKNSKVRDYRHDEKRKNKDRATRYIFKAGSRFDE